MCFELGKIFPRFQRDGGRVNLKVFPKKIAVNAEALYLYNGAHQEFKAAMSAASTSILRVAAIAGTEHVCVASAITIEHFVLRER